MKAITIWEPWATLIAIGAKHFETRSWPTTYRGPIAIHAACRKPNLAAIPFADLGRMHAAFEEAGLNSDDLFPWLGRVLAIGELTACLPTAGLDVSDDERAFGDFTAGRFAWVIEGFKRLDPPAYARGMQGLWEWKAPVEQAV